MGGGGGGGERGASPSTAGAGDPDGRLSGGGAAATVPGVGLGIELLGQLLRAHTGRPRRHHTCPLASFGGRGRGSWSGGHRACQSPSGGRNQTGRAAPTTRGSCTGTIGRAQGHALTWVIAAVLVGTVGRDETFLP